MFIMPLEWGTETLEEIVQAGKVCLVLSEGGGLATNCISCCSCMVRAARVVLMLFSEMCCLSMSS